MRGLLHKATALLASCMVVLTAAQEYMGDVIPNSLPGVPGSEIAYWKIKDGINNNVTLINYISHGSDGQRLPPANIKRVVIIIHGLNQDPGTYEANMLSALSQVSDPNININNVAVVAPYFANGDNKNVGYPWVNGLAPNRGSISNCLVWKSSQWSAGGNNQYPYFSTNISSYTVLDQMIQYFDNVAMFPNMNQIVIAGHSLGAQTVQRYAAIGKQLNTRSPVTYWVANPNSYVWLSTSRPLATSSCSIYDNYREGFTNFSSYPMTYGLSLVNSGRANILANFNSKSINYARGTQDLGDDSSTCAAETTGSNRNERFFNFIKAFPPSCSDPTSRNCDTIDFVNAGHDGGAMMASAAGQARLFTDNFYGNGSRAYDFGYPRQQPGDDPFPNPALNASTTSTNNNTYAGNMTYWGCWSDQTPRSLANMVYDSNVNTIEQCTAACAQGNNTIAGLEFGSQCFCGNSLGYQATQVIETSCQTTCPGNSSEICGGPNRLSLFSSGRPYVNAQPGTPETVGSFYYSNCYTEATAGRALTGPSTSGSFVNLEYCANFCSSYQYFGTEYADECYCGNSFSAGANITSSGDCSMTCAGSVSEFCGAGNRLTVYVNPNWVAGASVSSSSAVTPSSTSGAGSASSTAAGSTAPSSTAVSCPASNNTVVTSNGQNFTIECGIDHSGGDLTSLTVNSFQQCIDACAQNNQCVDVSLSGSACYLKSVLGGPVSMSVIWGARLVVGSSSTTGSSSLSISSTASVSTSTLSSSAGTTTGVSASTSTSSSVQSTSSQLSTSSALPSSTSSAIPTPSPVSCPSSNSTMYTTSGQTFLIECGIDHQGGDMAPGNPTGTFPVCVALCATTTGCVDVSFLGNMCYMKSTLGAPVNNGVWGAKLIGPASGSSVSSSTAGASSSITASSPGVTVSSPGSTSSSESSSLAVSVSTDSSLASLNSASTITTSPSSTFAGSSSVTSSSTSTSGSSSLTSSSSGSSSSTSISNSTPSTSPSQPPTTLSTSTTTSSSSSQSTSPTATPIKLSCPASNNTLYTAPTNGYTFLIECNIDHNAGDMGMVYVSSFNQCVDTCDKTAGCVDVSLSGAACYLKKTLGAARVANGILGAKVVGQPANGN